MLIMVYNPDPEIGANAEIVKFSDRIWFDSSGNAKCLRSVIIHVLDESTRPISELCFLTPAARDDVVPQDIVDKSDTCPHLDYAFNKFKTGEYKVIDTNERGGTISNDGFETVAFRYGNKAEITGIDNASLITLGLGQPIQPGEFREVRFLFAVKSIATKFKEETYAIDLPYFGELTSFSSYAGATKALRAHKQIPVIPIYNKESRQGGFDVIVYLPPGATGSDFPPQALRSIDNHDEEALQSEGREKYIWRMRQATDAPAVTLGAAFSILGNWSPAIQRRISDVDRMVYIVATRLADLHQSSTQALTDLRRSSTQARVIAIVSLVIAIAALILLLVLR